MQSHTKIKPHVTCAHECSGPDPLHKGIKWPAVILIEDLLMRTYYSLYGLTILITAHPHRPIVVKILSYNVTARRITDVFIIKEMSEI